MPHDNFQSGLSRHQLCALLDLIRCLPRIADTPDDEALQALDVLLANFETAKQEVPSQTKHEVSSQTETEWQQRDFESRVARLKEDLDRHQKHIDRVRAAIATPGSQLLWEARSLLAASERIGEYYETNIQDTFRSEINSLRAEAKEVAIEAEVAAHEHEIHQALTQTIYNSGSVKAIIENIDHSLISLQRMSRLQEKTVLQAREGKARAARYRCQKKLDEAEVAEVGGNGSKAQKLRREAAVLLSQDWAQAFPDEQPPPP